MANNPFDVFAAGFQAAVPNQGAETAALPSAAAPIDNNGGINIMAQPAPVPVQVMNSGPPPPNMSRSMHPSMQHQGMNNGGMPPQMMTQSMNGMYGAPPPQHNNMGGGMNMGRPPQVPGGALVPSAQQNNPYASMLGAPPPGAGMGGPPPMPPAGAPPPFGQPPMGQPPMGQPNYGQPPMAQPNYGQPPQQQQQPPQQQQHFSSGGSLAGSVYSQPNTPARRESASSFVAQPPQSPAVNNFFGAPQPGAAPADASPFGAPPPSPGMPPAGMPQPVYHPAAPPPAAPPTDPWATPGAVDAGAIVARTGATNGDPFGIFGAQAPPAPQPVVAPPAAAAAPASQDDPWGDMGFSAPPAAPAAAAGAGAIVAASVNGVSGASLMTEDASAGQLATVPSHHEGDLPSGGEWYDAKIFTPTLGVMFFKPQELTDSLFLQTEKSLVDTLDDRPVVAFIVEGSSARSAGVELGHVLLKVNGIDVKNPKEASRLIKEGPRPLPLLFYVPDTVVVVAEGEHMVKYDSRETTAPNSAKDWKPKYCVIGGIIAQPWMMNMYRSKSEYDIAVIETQARRPVSVKVKQFSLQGARIQNDWQGPQMVKYKNKMHPWKYVVVLPVSRNPIKISSPNLSQLKPAHEGIRRVLMAQQRDKGNPNQHSAEPATRADPYAQPQRASQNNQNNQNNNQYGESAPRYENAGGVSSERRRHEY
eukprot:CAMPEP_0197833664 /NCGR_PEP_ID=MMETSP1437-20131217/19746_1 /TAXON_ID=49252 ORGANISM="Eucampia antarctica, Strain CCMP1452" /NCGR_SAMPLE_ID=MMETSP1437 /ASSEMBLY_ACC=CAM_ASM_001096 /LENGTH=699 /DNA_ID=CAMNT_0043437851 /DNA_START=36 /DNA_END=2135 /DNA_ORIENTATION=+